MKFMCLVALIGFCGCSYNVESDEGETNCINNFKIQRHESVGPNIFVIDLKAEKKLQEYFINMEDSIKEIYVQNAVPDSDFNIKGSSRIKKDSTGGISLIYESSFLATKRDEELRNFEKKVKDRVNVVFVTNTRKFIFKPCGR